MRALRRGLADAHRGAGSARSARGRGGPLGPPSSARCVVPAPRPCGGAPSLPPECAAPGRPGAPARPPRPCRPGAPAALEHRPGPTHLPDTRRGWRGQPAWGGQSGGRTCPTCAALSALRVVRRVPAMTWAAGGRGGSLPATPSKPGGAHPAGPSRTSCTSPSARLSLASCGATLNQL